MKKFLLSLATLALAGGAAMAAPAEIFTVSFGSKGNVSADNVDAYDKVTTYTGKEGTAIAKKTWTVTNFNNYNNGWNDMIKCGRKKVASTGSVATDFAFPEKITSIELSVVVNYVNVTSIDLYTSADGKTWSSNAVASVTDITKNTASVTLTDPAPAANKYYKINFVCTAHTSKNGLLSLKSITYNGEAALSGDQKPANLSFDEQDFVVAIDETFTAPTLNNPNNLPVTWTSSNEEVATVDAAGKVTLVGVGETIITATSEETEKFGAGKAFYNLTVKKAGIIYENACTTADCGFESELVNGTFNPWSIDKTYGLKASGYKSGASNASDAIMYSPVLHVPAGKVAVLNFEHALNQFKINNVNIEYTQENVNKYCKVVAAKVVNGVAENLVTVGEATISADLNEFSWTFFPNAEIELPSDMTGDIIIGFHYISTAECAGTWEIKNVEVTLADGVVAPTAAEIVSIEALSSDNANVAAEYDAEGDVWTLIGDVKVASDNINVFTLQVNVAEGAELWYYAAGSEVGGQPLALAEEGDSDLPPLTQSTDGKIIVPAGEGGAALYTKRNGVLTEPVMLQYYVTVTKDSSTSIVEVIDGDGDAEVYDLMGRRINNAKGLKGLYIVNGKKMILR